MSLWESTVIKTCPGTLNVCRKHPGESVSSTSVESVTSPAEEELSRILRESSYVDYLVQARLIIGQCARACRNWSAPYDGEHPAPDSILDHPASSAPVATSNTVDTTVNSAHSAKGSGGDTGSENNNGVSSDSPDERKRSNSTLKLLSHGNVSESGNVRLPDSETLEQQANNSGGDRRTRGANNSSSGGETESDRAALSRTPSNSSSSSSVICETQCNKVPSSSSPSARHSSSLAPSSSLARPPPPSQRTLGLASKLRSCLDLDSFLACLNELDLSSAQVSNGSLEESLASLDGLLNAVIAKREMAPGSNAKKSADGTRHASFDGDRVGAEKPSDAQASSNSPSADRPVSDGATASSTMMTTTTTTKQPALPSSPQVRKSPAPPQTLGLAPAKEISFGGKCRALSPLRTPDDMSRAFLMSPTSPGFLLSPSSSSSSAALRRLPAALRYSSSPPNIGKRRFSVSLPVTSALLLYFFVLLFPAVAASLWLFKFNSCSFLLLCEPYLLCVVACFHCIYISERVRLTNCGCTL